MRIPESYVELGLTGLARSGDKTVFTGHYGAALLAAYFMDAENDLPEYVQEGLIKNCEYYQEKHAEFFNPLNSEEADINLKEKIVNGIKSNLITLRSSAHGAILGVLALKAIIKRPDLCVPSIVEGICKTLDMATNDRVNRYFGIHNYHNFTRDEIFGIPKYHTINDMIEISLAECQFAAPNRTVGDTFYFFTGELEHGVTFAHALVCLDMLGYPELTELGMETHRLQMYLNRQRPEEVIQETIINPDVSSLFDRNYWRKTYDDPHSIKVPYSAIDLLKRLSGAKRQKAEFNVCKILSQME